MEEDRYIRITLRIPREVHSRLDFEAARTSKSLNAEIVSRLEESFRVEARAMNEELLREMRRTQILLQLHAIETSLAQAAERRERVHRVIHESHDTAELTAARDQLLEVADEREDLEKREAVLAAKLEELDALRKPHT